MLEDRWGSTGRAETPASSPGSLYTLPWAPPAPPGPASCRPGHPWLGRPASCRPPDGRRRRARRPRAGRPDCRGRRRPRRHCARRQDPSRPAPTLPARRPVPTGRRRRHAPRARPGCRPARRRWLAPRPRPPIVSPPTATTRPRGPQALLASPAGLLPAAAADAVGPRRPATPPPSGIPPPVPADQSGGRCAPAASCTVRPASCRPAAGGKGLFPPGDPPLSLLCSGVPLSRPAAAAPGRWPPPRRRRPPGPPGGMRPASCRPVSFHM